MGGINALEMEDHGPPPSDHTRDLIKSGKWAPRNPFTFPDGQRPDASAVPLLTTLLEDEDKLVRRFAARELRVIGPDSRPAIPALIRMLEDEDDGIKAAAASTLAAIGRDAKEAVPALLDLLTDKRRGFRRIHARRNAAEALRTIDPETAAKVPDLLDHRLRDEDFADFERMLGIPPKKPADPSEIQ
jgi:hypothetical protein